MTNPLTLSATRKNSNPRLNSTSKEVEDLKSSLNRITQNLSNNNSFERDKDKQEPNSNMILGGLKEKIQSTKEEKRCDLPQPMKYKK